MMTSYASFFIEYKGISPCKPPPAYHCRRLLSFRLFQLDGVIARFLATFRNVISAGNHGCGNRHDGTGPQPVGRDLYHIMLVRLAKEIWVDCLGSEGS